MAEKYVFKGNALVSGKMFHAGAACPASLVDELRASGLIEKVIPVETKSEKPLEKLPEQKLAEFKEKEKRQEK
jgi:hypothetical protein